MNVQSQFYKSPRSQHLVERIIAIRRKPDFEKDADINEIHVEAPRLNDTVGQVLRVMELVMGRG